MTAGDRSFPLVLARTWHDRQDRNVIQDFTPGYPVDLGHRSVVGAGLRGLSVTLREWPLGLLPA